MFFELLYNFWQLTEKQAYMFVDFYVTQESVRTGASRTRLIQGGAVLRTDVRDYGVTLIFAIAAFLLGLVLGKFAL